MSIAQNLLDIKSSLPDNVTLVAVSKTKPVSDLMEAYEAGQRIFGENKIQEMTEKWQQMPKDIEWHMIGHVQSNKVKYMVPYVKLIHGVDSFLSLLERLKPQCSSTGARLGLAIHSLRAATPDEIHAVLSAGPAAGPIHIHVAEQEREVEDCLAWSGRRPVDWLYDHVDVDRRWCLIHATHIDRAEIAGLAASGAAAGLCCFFTATSLKRWLGYDDSLDVFGVHAVGGIVGAILTGVFAAPALGGFGTVTDIGAQVWIQAKGVGFTVVYTAVATLVILKAIDWAMGLRVGEEAEAEGLDLALHNERGYNL